jgi:hypothetical protein
LSNVKPEWRKQLKIVDLNSRLVRIEHAVGANQRPSPVVLAEPRDGESHPEMCERVCRETPGTHPIVILPPMFEQTPEGIAAWERKYARKRLKD